ncbi:hypothetical protein O181_072132 [Austropuccinia psidii MF-1]|uniref:Uncharacterized protein n=1 Tax=Austropuccinia psidii MF-1 TaxID=1389203 RepID=A0A9Q3F6I5_9BASI|nr:hypothetical protein [Austropuccinia psidii MF-1]
MPNCGCPDVILANGILKACSCQPCSSGNLTGCSCNKETGCGCTSSILPIHSMDRCSCALASKICTCTDCACKNNNVPGSCCA